MLIVETIAKIRRAFFDQGRPTKAICRELRVSRKVVRKVIRSEATGKQRLYNRRFLQMCGHYLVEPVACTPASGWRRGKSRIRSGSSASASSRRGCGSIGATAVKAVPSLDAHVVRAYGIIYFASSRDRVGRF